MSIAFNDAEQRARGTRRGETAPIGHLVNRIRAELAAPHSVWPSCDNSKDLKRRLLRALSTIKRVDPGTIGLTRTRAGQLIDLALTIADDDLAHDGGIMSAQNQYYGDRLGVKPETMTTIFRDLKRAGMLEARNPTTNHRRSCHKTHQGHRDGRGYSLRPAVAMLGELERSAERLERECLELAATHFEAKQILAECNALSNELSGQQTDERIHALRRQLKRAYVAKNTGAAAETLEAAARLKATLLGALKTELQRDLNNSKISDETHIDSRQHHTAGKITPEKVSANQIGGSGEVPPLPSSIPPNRSCSARPNDQGQMTCGLTRQEAFVLFETGRQYIPATDDHQEWIIAACNIGKALSINPRLMAKGFETLGIEQMLWGLHIVNWRSTNGLIDKNAGAYFNGMLRKAQANELNLDRTIWGIRTELSDRTPLKRSPSAMPAQQASARQSDLTSQRTAGSIHNP